MSTTLRFKTNLNCQSCIDSVKPHLDSEPSIHHWEVDTKVPEKILTVAGENVSEELVEAAVVRAGFKVLGKAPQPVTTIRVEEEHADEPRVTYYPLLLLVAFLFTIVSLVELRAGSFEWARAMQSFMGGFFITFSFFKLLDLKGFAESYQMYDVIAKKLPLYGYLYPFVELMLGAAYIANIQPFATNLVTVVVMSASSIGVVQSLLEKRKIRCACLGTVFNLPMSTVTLVEDVAMIAMSVTTLLLG